MPSKEMRSVSESSHEDALVSTETADAPDWLINLWGRVYLEISEDFLLIWDNGQIWIVAEGDAQNPGGWYCGRTPIIKEPTALRVRNLMRMIGIELPIDRRLLCK